MEQNTKTELTSLAQVSHVNPFPWRDLVRALMMSVRYGRKWSEFSEMLNPLGSSERTFQGCLPLDNTEENTSTTSAIRYPKWGIALDGAYMALKTLVLFTEGTESSSLPTPTAFDAHNIPIRNGHNLDRGGRHNVGLKDMIPVFADHLLPTPRANQAMAVDLESNYAQNHKHKNLEVVIAKDMLPTPSTFDAKTFKKKDLSDKTTKNGKRGGRTLVADIGNQFPEVTGESGTQPPSSTRPVLNPEFVERMMGFPIGWTDLNVSETR